VDDLLHTDLDLNLAMNSSMRSFASSITTPPSQSGSFYHRVQKQNEVSETEQNYGYGDTELTGNVPGDWVSNSTDDDDTGSNNSWGGFSNKHSTGDTNSVGSGIENSSVKSSPTPSRRTIKSRSKSSRLDDTNNGKKKKKQQKKKKKRLKDFFRKSAEQNEAITEVDEADLVTESEGKEGSMALLPLSDKNLKRGSGDSDIDSQSEQDSVAHSHNSKQSNKSGKSKGSKKGNNRRQSPSSRASNSPKNSPKNSPRMTPKTSKARNKKRNSPLRGSVHTNSSAKTGTSAKPKAVRRGSYGALTRRMSLGGKSDDSDAHFGENHDAGQQGRAIRRSSLGGGTEPGNAYDSENPHRAARRRSSLGNMIGNVVRRGSLGGGGGGNEYKGPIIPEDYHNIIHRERAARGMYLLQRHIILDTLAQGIANDLAAGRAPTPCEFYGNIGKGTSLSVIHSKIMEERKGVSRKNILSERFTSFGMGLAIGGEKNESIFMCTLFKE